MKLITAFIRRRKLAEVTAALHRVKGLTGASVCDVRGFGRGQGSLSEKLLLDTADYIPRVRLEVACSEEILDDVVGVIEKNGHTGLRGDGKIYITTIEQAVRISTGERGETAV